MSYEFYRLLFEGMLLTRTDLKGREAMADTKDIETRLAELEASVRNSAAAQRVTTLLSMQLLIRMSLLTDDPHEFVKIIMENMERDLERAVKAAQDADEPMRVEAQAAASYFSVMTASAKRMMLQIPARSTH
ncbi:hypothetical protein LPJGGPFB_04336 [Ensifer adhaerens]|uniref:hypothetical protein n=1 Tax=Ensifer adhaerens TaxID=106592 RepID=UPI0015696895|nr:hypothetical protein [Ensifer adhaerens]NRP21077.1 hypothetical protein [Ensifer adhaerens]